MTKMSRDFKDGTEMRLFLWGLMNNEEWGSEDASYTEQHRFITVVLPLGEGVNARIGASVKDLQATLKFTGDHVGESETFSKMIGLRQVFRTDSKNVSGSGSSTNDLPGTQQVLSDLIDPRGPLPSNMNDMYGPYDSETGGSFHGC